MRRTPIQRRTPLKRTGFQRKPAKAKPHAAERAEWGRQWECCMVCGRRLPLDLHEMVTRARAALCFVVANLLAVCRYCHDVVLVWLPLVVQLACKKLADPAGYDLQAVNRLRNRAEDSITPGEVKGWEEFVLALRGHKT